MPRRTTPPTETLSRFLASQGLKSTRQRNRILETLLRTRGHVSAEALLAQVRAEDPAVSTATVYRTLKLLTECGLANAQQFGDGSTRYEAAAGRDHHDHLICTACGAIVEFEDPRIEHQQERVAQEHGFVLQHHRMDLFGLCRRCQRAQRASEPE